MPCSDNGWSESIKQQLECEEKEYDANVMNTQFDKERKGSFKNIDMQLTTLHKYIDKLESRCDMYARMMCYIMHCAGQDNINILCNGNPELKKWFSEHERFDKMRM
jgi:hypothetical protein